jgi:DnaJ-class molecular chaperone
MTFGKRFSAHNNRPEPLILRTCERCYGSGRIRERGNRIVCKPCQGTGKTTAADRLCSTILARSAETA